MVQRQGQTVRGQVVRSDGSPAAAIRVEALISVSNTRMESAVTDENGRFELTHLVKIPDALSLTDNNTWRRDEVDISGMDLTNLKVRFDGDGVTLHGRVVDYKTRAPIGQANVSLYGREVETGSAGPGTFTAPGLMRGAVNTFRVSAPGYVPAKFEITAKPGDSQIEHTVHLGPGGKITGRLLTEKGEPATDREVVLVLGNQQYSVAELERHGATRTDQGGWFHFEAIPPGWATVIVRPEAPLAPIYEAVEVQHGEETQVGNLELGRGSNVVVTVVDATSGKPVSGAEVRISGTGISWGKTANTDATGQVRVAGAYGSETIVSIPQYHVYESFETDEEKLIERTFEVGQADLRGTMVRNGHPLFGEVGISRPGTVIRPLSTDSQGRFIIRNLAAGRWDLRFVYHEDSSAEKVEWETTIEIPATGLEREFEVR